MRQGLLVMEQDDLVSGLSIDITANIADRQSANLR